MKKKVYLIIYAVVQLVLCIYYGFTAGAMAESQLEMYNEIFTMYPAETQEMLKSMFTVDSLRSSILLTVVACGILAIILLWIFAKDKLSEKKWLALWLTVASVFLLGDIFIIILGGIAIYLIAKTPKSEVTKEVKEKKAIQKLRPLKVDSKDILLTVLFVLLYATQFFIDYLINGVVMGVIVLVVYYVGVVGFGIYAYQKQLKRDFTAYKENARGYLGYAFKWWGIMLGLSFIAAIIRIVLGGNAVTANQDGLNSSPLWYIAPLSIIWAPFVEELVFRGSIRRFIKNDKVFVVVSALVFGLIHTITSEVGLYNMIIQSLQYMVMGGVMAHVYAKTNNICVNMTIHCIQNTIGVIFIMML